jgi:predicted metal-dependent hydrolase
MIENGQPDGSFVLHHGGKQTPFTVDFRKRTKLAITVHPDMRVEVGAPAGSPLDRILARVEKRAGWILKQLYYFEQYQPTQPGPRYISGETHVFLGRQYRLKVREGKTEAVKLIGRFFSVWVKDSRDTASVQRLLESWHRDHAEPLFAHRLRGIVECTPSLGFKTTPRLLIRKMDRRWGSCTKAGNILLNVELMRAPIHCIDYVIVHELCHLKVHNHGAEFYRLLSRCMPDWLKRKQRLERVVVPR